MEVWDQQPQDYEKFFWGMNHGAETVAEFEDKYDLHNNCIDRNKTADCA